jgi:AbiV family abortive infection protein
MPVSTQYLLEGASFALEQCGILLRDANTLYKSTSYASAIVLAAFAREELGRYKILLGFWREASAGKKTFTVEEINEACDNHVSKQQAGMLSTSLTGDNTSGVGKLIQTSITAPPQSEEWKEARVALEEADKAKTKRTPDVRHRQRMKSLYVEPVSNTSWNRPGYGGTQFPTRRCERLFSSISTEFQSKQFVGVT